MNRKIIFIFALCTFSLSACIKPFQPAIQQGNIINNSSLQEIESGMSKQEVLYILGSPMLTDPFNSDRWDYFYSKKDQNTNETTTRLVTAIFDGDQLKELTGDVDLSNVASLDPSREDHHTGGTVVTKPTQKEKGILSRWFSKKR